jgi:hypothetical protein
VPHPPGEPQEPVHKDGSPAAPEGVRVLVDGDEDLFATDGHWDAG